MRKFITFLMLLCVTHLAFAQTLQLEDTINITRERWRDTCFGLIDKSSSLIPSGMFRNYAMEFTHPNAFNNDAEKIY